MPVASAKSAAPPRTTSPEREICSNVPARGAETHGLTITAENAPMAATEAMRPPRKRSWLASPNEAMNTSSFSRRAATLRKGSSSRMEPDSDGTNSFAFWRIWRRTRSRSMSLFSDKPDFCRSRNRSSCGASSE